MDDDTRWLEGFDAAVATVRERTEKDAGIRAEALLRQLEAERLAFLQGVVRRVVAALQRRIAV